MRTLLCCLLPFFGCTAATQSYRSGYEAGFAPAYEREFSESCSAGLVKRGQPEPESQALCECLARALVSENEVGALERASRDTDGAEFKAMIGNARTQCEEEDAALPR
jgi:hypothetical protein